jgi:hypothetical protein
MKKRLYLNDLKAFSSSERDPNAAEMRFRRAIAEHSLLHHPLPSIEQYAHKFNGT